jgi:ABC-2 type transport system ATP-binding protein
MQKSPTVPAIQVHDLWKVYIVSQQEGEAAAGLSGILRRKKIEVPAVDGISFEVSPGEVVGFLGPNGAGKTTTLKMLSGLLFPTSGTVSVLGRVPWNRESAYLRQITLIMGQRNQLVWDIAPIRSFELNRAIYQIPQADYDSLVKELTDLLDLGPLLNKPVRNLSLGERMKCEFAAALLHRPKWSFWMNPPSALTLPCSTAYGTSSPNTTAATMPPCC